MVVRTKPPKTFSPAIKSFPLPEATTLRNGIQAYSYNMGSQPVFKLEIIIKYGSANLKNPLDGSIGINLLREGTKTKSAEEINKLLAYYGSFLELKSNLDFSTITLYGRSEFLKELILLLSEILSEPAFKEVALTKHKALARQNLEISKKKDFILVCKVTSSGGIW